jgi:hypothetical protein
MKRFDIYEQLKPKQIGSDDDGAIYAANLDHHGYIDCYSAREAIRLSRKIIRWPIVQEKPYN